ncbi:50S ribosomal protein L22 [Candidatus Parcubacteria bacterium]|nr:MAG: 50S ribosomal protein L22 [Candidatus Parcubacteria bacterium]
MHITAELNYLRLAPRKVRLIADAIRGKRVPDAERTLQFLGRRAALPVAKLLRSAVANARHNFQISDPATLTITEIRVDQGPMLKRIQPRAMGRAFRIRKKTSHIRIVLEASKAPARRAKAKSDIAVVTEADSRADAAAGSRGRDERPGTPSRPTSRQPFTRRIFRRKAI